MKIDYEKTNKKIFKKKNPKKTVKDKSNQNLIFVYNFNLYNIRFIKSQFVGCVTLGIVQLVINDECNTVRRQVWSYLVN